MVVILGEWWAHRSVFWTGLLYYLIWNCVHLVKINWTTHLHYLYFCSDVIFTSVTSLHKEQIFQALTLRIWVSWSGLWSEDLIQPWRGKWLVQGHVVDRAGTEWALTVLGVGRISSAERRYNPCPWEWIGNQLKRSQGYIPDINRERCLHCHPDVLIGFCHLGSTLFRASQISSQHEQSGQLAKWMALMRFPPPAPLLSRHCPGADTTWTLGSNRYSFAFWFCNLLAHTEFYSTLIFLICKIGTKLTPTPFSPPRDMQSFSLSFSPHSVFVEPTFGVQSVRPFVRIISFNPCQWGRFIYDPHFIHEETSNQRIQVACSKSHRWIGGGTNFPLRKPDWEPALNHCGDSDSAWQQSPCLAHGWNSVDDNSAFPQRCVNQSWGLAVRKSGFYWLDKSLLFPAQ